MSNGVKFPCDGGCIGVGLVALDRVFFFLFFFSLIVDLSTFQNRLHATVVGGGGDEKEADYH